MIAAVEKPKLRVLQVFGTLGIGGAETWLLSLLKYFNENEDSLPFTVETSICHSATYCPSWLPGVMRRIWITLVAAGS